MNARTDAPRMTPEQYADKKATDKADSRLRLRLAIASRLIGADHFELSNEPTAADLVLTRKAARRALQVADLLIEEAER